jgi:8-oxo-dGTP pyrophosphatase MutT (NUDIX family)
MTSTSPVLINEVYFAASSKISPSKRQASVFIPLCNRSGVASILYTLRTTTVSTHKGQVSFPGGHIEKNETPEEACIREFREEIGGSTFRLRILGRMQSLPSITGTLVHPIIGYIEGGDVGDLSAFTVNSSEVDHVFTRTLDDLFHGPRSISKYSRFGMDMELPVYGNDGDTERIWGLTAIITNALCERVLSTCFSEKYSPVPSSSKL